MNFSKEKKKQLKTITTMAVSILLATSILSVLLAAPATIPDASAAPGDRNGQGFGQGFGGGEGGHGGGGGYFDDKGRFGGGGGIGFGTGGGGCGGGPNGLHCSDDR